MGPTSSFDCEWERFSNFHLNITFADNELVEYEEGEDDSHGEGDEAELVRVHLRWFGGDNVGISQLLSAIVFSWADIF